METLPRSTKEYFSGLKVLILIFKLNVIRLCLATANTAFTQTVGGCFLKTSDCDI